MSKFLNWIDEVTPNVLTETNEFREEFDLPKIRQGIVTCLKCDREFFSHDVTKYRLCQLHKGRKYGPYEEGYSVYW